MRIPKLSKLSDSDQQKNDKDNLSCLFCSQPVKNSNLAKYENHLVQRHNLEKHVQQTILDTFNGQKRSLEKKNEEIFSMKSVKDVMESMEKINKEKLKGTFKKTIDKGTDPLKDLLDFVEKTEKDMITKKKVEQIKIKSEGSVNSLEHVMEETPVEATVHYKCNDCDKSYDRAAKLNFHVKKTHSNIKKTALTEKDASPKKSPVDTVNDNENSVDHPKDHDWADYRIFDCQVCLTKMPSSMYPDHLLTWHSLSLSDYKEKTGDSGSCSPADYKCLICISNIPWEKSSLQHHLATHKLTIEQYSVIFDKAIEKQVEKQTEMVKKGKAASSPEKSMDNKFTTKKEVISENRVECIICQKLFTTNFKLQRHVKTDHCDTSKASSVKPINAELSTVTVKQVKTEPVSEETKEKFDCQICKEEFPWSEVKIKDHLSQKHCLTKEFYFTLYGTNTGRKSEDKTKENAHADDKFPCKDCLFTSTRKGALTLHTQKYHETTEEVACCKKKFRTKWALFVHLTENHKEKELFTKFQVWPGLEKYYSANR